MCKIMGIPGIKPEKSKEAVKFAKAAQFYMCRADRDGYGYAAWTHDAKMFVERWLEPKDAFVNRYEQTEEEKALTEAFQGALQAKLCGYNRMGKVDLDNVQSLILHSRFATCEKGLFNTHPFVWQEGGVALIHNGVITNAEQLEMYTSTCDSETILNSYVEHGVDVAPDNIKKVADELRGYYACAVLGNDQEGKPYLDIFRSSGASLVVAKIKELETLVFCTTLEILEGAAKDSGMTIEFSFWVASEKMIRMDSETGAVLGVFPFTERKTHWSGNSGGNSNVSNFPATQGGGTPGSRYVPSTTTATTQTNDDGFDMESEAEISKRLASLMEKDNLTPEEMRTLTDPFHVGKGS